MFPGLDIENLVRRFVGIVGLWSENLKIDDFGQNKLRLSRKLV